MERSSDPRPSEGVRRSDPTSPTLLAGVKVGNEEAWTRLVRLYTPFLRYWCRRWGIRGEEIDDIVQEVFQGAFLRLEAFRQDRQGDSFRAWLRGIARHKVLTHLRRGGARGPGGTDFYRRSLLVPDPGDRPMSDEENAEEQFAVEAVYRDALGLVRAEFEDRTWQAFWRAAVDGQAPAIIAEDLGVTAAAIRQAKSRVLRRIKEVLGEPICMPGATRPV